MSEIDWSKAPAGTTHYRAAGGMYYGGFYRHEANGDWFFFVDGSWEFMGAPDESEAHPLIPRPTKPEPKEWDGEGNPVIGSWVEGMRNGKDWIECFYIGPDEKGNRWFKTFKTIDSETEFSVFSSTMRLRPIRTQAEREREELARFLQTRLLRNDCRDLADAILSKYNLTEK